MSISYFLDILAILMAVPVCVFCLEIIAALFLPTRNSLNSSQNRPQRIAVLVPAHNESAGLGLTLENIKTQLLKGDRLLVVADNCTDDTAIVALAADAEVIVRNDPSRGGKGYALDFGLNHLSLDPPAVVIIIDADCRITDDTIERLATTCAATHRPIQALNLMTAADESPIKYHVAEFAWRVKNWVRPLGLKALGLPCHLTGTGMAFPWELIASSNLGHGSTVEDLNLGLELAHDGDLPLFCPTAGVSSFFPLSIEGAKTQRKRWEEGHVRLIVTAVPRLLFRAIVSGNFGLLALTLDLLVPPLALLVILVVGVFFAAVLAAMFGSSSTALFTSTASLAALGIAVLLAWLKYGRGVLPARRLFSIATYILQKLPLYRQLLTNRGTPLWVRTDRSDTHIAQGGSLPQPPIDP
jgi:cellulose synthase/poly-beta-1,6-N-acetylglucosamine synthase-like glycosyltransferase